MGIEEAFLIVQNRGQAHRRKGFFSRSQAGRDEAFRPDGAAIMHDKKVPMG